MRGDCTHRYKTSHRLRTACAAYQEKTVMLVNGMVWNGGAWKWLAQRSFMVLHGPSGSMQFLVKGTRQMLLDLMDWHILNSIIDLQISLFDVELCWVILMTVFPELGQSRKLSYLVIDYICVLIFFPANVGYILQYFCQVTNLYKKPILTGNQSVADFSQTQLFDRIKESSSHWYKTNQRLRTAFPVSLWKSAMLVDGVGW